jgi:hypothetical protein
MTSTIEKLDKIYLKNKGDYSSLTEWENGKILYKVINDTNKTMKVYKIDGALDKIL